MAHQFQSTLFDTCLLTAEDTARHRAGRRIVIVCRRKYNSLNDESIVFCQRHLVMNASLDLSVVGIVPVFVCKKLLTSMSSW